MNGKENHRYVTLNPFVVERLRRRRRLARYAKVRFHSFEQLLTRRILVWQQSSLVSLVSETAQAELNLIICLCQARSPKTYRSEPPCYLIHCPIFWVQPLSVSVVSIKLVELTTGGIGLGRKNIAAPYAECCDCGDHSREPCIESSEEGHVNETPFSYQEKGSKPHCQLVFQSYLLRSYLRIQSSI